MSGLLVAAPRRLAKMGFPAQAPTTRNGLVLPLEFTGCLASWIDRSPHLLLVLQTPNPGLAFKSPPLLYDVYARQAPTHNFARPSGASNNIYLVGKGLELIPTETNEVLIDVPGFQRRLPEGSKV
jgi:hypothetical protein